MGFCGCSLHGSTVSAGIYGIMFSIYGISWTSVLIEALNRWTPLESLLNPYYNSLFSFDNFFYLKFDRVLYVLVVLSLVLHLLWICSSIALLIGNENKNTTTLYLWVAVASIILISDLAGEIYCITKPFCNMFDFYGSTLSGICAGYLLVAILFNKLGLITIGIQIALAVYVSNRAKEIKSQSQLPTQFTVISPVPQSDVLPGCALTMQHYPVDGLQGPVNPPPQYRGAEDWNAPSPAFTATGMNRAYDLPPKKSHQGPRY